eukprot:5400262-Alexandrium_andersonii.AAC.1
MFALMTEAKAAANESGPSTMELVWRILFWSFEACVRGKWPAFDWNGDTFEHKDPARWQRAGQRLCGDYTFAWFQVAADLDYLCNYLSLRHFNSSVRPCF